MEFDEQGLVDYIREGLAKAFNTKEWKALFGGKKMQFSEDNFGQAQSFPIIYIDVDNCYEPDELHDSSQVENFTHFDFTIECYNQAKGELTKKQLGRKINAFVVKTLRELMNPHISYNHEVESPDDTVYRRKIDGYGIYDNQNNIFYR